MRTVVGEKFRGTQNPLQDAPQLFLVHNGEFVLLLSSALEAMAATFGQLTAVVDEP